MENTLELQVPCACGKVAPTAPSSHLKRVASDISLSLSLTHTHTHTHTSQGGNHAEVMDILLGLWQSFYDVFIYQNINLYNLKYVIFICQRYLNKGKKMSSSQRLGECSQQ